MARLGLLWGNWSGAFLVVILAAEAELLQQVEFHFAVERPVVGRRGRTCLYRGWEWVGEREKGICNRC